MAYKFKPNKSIAKRFRVTKTGKLKRGHSLTSHLMSGRSGNKKRKLGRPAIVAEGHARNMRRMMGISGTRPNKIAHDRAIKALKARQAAAAATTAAPVAAEQTPASEQK